MDEQMIEPVGPDRRTYQQYLDERKLLIEGERAAGEGFDKTLLTLCAGAIALSVTFVEKLGSAGKFKPLLYVSWGILVLGLLLNVRAFLVLQNSYERQLDINDELYVRGTSVLRNPFRTRFGSLNRYAYWCFVVGIGLLLLFAGVNYQSSSKEPSHSERTVITMEEKRGILAKIFNPENMGGGPNTVKLPHPQPPAKPQPQQPPNQQPASSKP
jgi:hypothetical protein